jgi:GNAT superfamily N-acetyltransferase
MVGNDATRELQVAPLTRAEAELTSQWRYRPELATYDGTTAAIADMLDPANHYHSIRVDGEYVGYVCVGADARVADLPAMHDVDDIGIGLAPDLVGRGLSRWLLPAVITCLDARGVLRGSVLRAVVLDWNIRSLTAAQRLAPHTRPRPAPVLSQPLASVAGSSRPLASRSDRPLTLILRD